MKIEAAYCLDAKVPVGDYVRSLCHTSLLFVNGFSAFFIYPDDVYVNPHLDEGL